MLRRLKNFLLLAALLWSSWAFGQSALLGEQHANQPAHFCFSDQVLKETLKNSPHLQGDMDLADQAIVRRISNRSGANNFLIPVVVYVVHNNGPENISDQQVQSQIIALNDAFDGRGVSFCLATEENGTALPGSNSNPGIIRVQSSLTNHDVADEATLKALSPLPASRYLRIWVVNDIVASGVSGSINGYARLPAVAPPALDGIVMRANVFGDLSTCGGCTMGSGYGEGDILVHEVGHYLNLHHTFHEGCAGMTVSDCALAGDRVCDTPPVAVPNSGCPTGMNSCSETPNLPDLINNFMDYTNESCLSAFTTGQEDRMCASINMYRSLLVSSANHTYTGVNCSGNVVASFTANNNSPCIGATVQFVAGFISGATYTWDFGDGTTSSGTSIVNHTYTSSYQPAYVTLTVDDGTNSASATEALFVENCTAMQSESGHWYFGRRQGLDFASGAPVYDPAALNNNTMSTGALMESAAVQSDANGNLLFYTDGLSVWNNNHQLINAGNTLAGHQSALQGVVIVPDPGNSNEYYIFTSYTGVLASNPHNGCNYSKVVMSGNNATMSTTINVPLAAPPGYITDVNNALVTREGLTAMASCNGYWFICEGEKTSGRFLMVYEVTSAGISFVSEFQAPGPGPGGVKGGVINLQVSPNGNRLAASFYNNAGPNRDLLVYDFDKFSGTISNEQFLSNDGPLGLSFSPNSNLLYTVQQSTKVLQYDVSAPNPASTEIEVGDGMYGQMQIGPDDKIYISRYGANKLGVIHRPDTPSSNGSPNACFYNAAGPLMQTGVLRFGLPNFINATSIGVFSNTFSYTQSSCLTYNFFPDVCGSTFNWNFGDPASGGNNTSSATFPSHTFSGPGSYTVTLSVTGGPTITQTLVVGISAPAIVGPLCDVSSGLNSYSVNPVPGVDYTWTVSGGTILSLPNAPAIDVNWNSLPGTITVVATDQQTGCTATTTETVEQSCGGDPCTDECKMEPALDLVKKENCTYEFYGSNTGVICPSQLYQWKVYNANTGVLVATLPGQNVSYTFPASGKYKVCLEIYVLGTNELIKCIESKCKEIEVECKGCDGECDLEPSINHSFPRSCFYEFYGANKGTVCPNQQYRWTVYSATSGLLLAVIDGQNISYALPGSGKYKICLEIFVTDANGDVKCTKTNCIELKRTCISCDKPCDIKPEFRLSTRDGCNYSLVGNNAANPCYTQIYRWTIFNPLTGAPMATLYGQNTTYDFTTSGNHKICLEIFVIDDNGKIKCIEEVCKEVRIRCDRMSLREAVETETALWVSHQPNPTASNANFTLNVESDEQAVGVLRIVNVNGVTLMERNVATQGSALISTEGLAPGMYFYYVEVNEKSSNVGKLVIIQGK